MDRPRRGRAQWGQLVSPAYDVRVESATGSSGDSVRVLAADETAATAAALERFPEGWVATEVSDASDHGDAWGTDLTQPGAPLGPIVTEGEPPAIDE